MANADVVAFNIAAFISTLFLLEFGADKFVDHTAIVSRRIGVSQALVALLTAGAEWEELGVVVASLSRSNSSLAVGNVIGSAISNILGAFSLGLLFRARGNMTTFDRSSKIYSALLLLLTTFVAPITIFPRKDLWRPCGGILIGLFAVYVTSIAWAIGRGRITAPESSDSESSSESDSEDENHHEPSQGLGENRPPDITQPETESNTERDPLIHQRRPSLRLRRKVHNLRYHLFYLLFGFLSICLASYILSHAASTITAEFGISEVLFGVIFLAIATTLPEKFVAVISGFRGHVGILVANTAGSNIFLLSLCLGVIMLMTEGDLNSDNVNVSELAVLWSATVAFTATVWFGERWSRWIGGIMLLSYIAFLALEFLVIRRV